MELCRRYQISNWNESTARTVVNYLKTRRFANAEVLASSPGPVVAGTRGTWLGNLTSFDMTKLRASIRFTPDGPGVVAVRLEVSTTAQEITEWNAAVWRLELVEVRRVLSGRALLGDLWPRFNRDARRAALRWALTGRSAHHRVAGAICGEPLAKTWAIELTTLEREDA